MSTPHTPPPIPTAAADPRSAGRMPPAAGPAPAPPGMGAPPPGPAPGGPDLSDRMLIGLLAPLVQGAGGPPPVAAPPAPASPGAPGLGDLGQRMLETALAGGLGVTGGGSPPPTPLAASTPPLAFPDSSVLAGVLGATAPDHPALRRVMGMGFGTPAQPPRDPGPAPLAATPATAAATGSREPHGAHASAHPSSHPAAATDGPGTGGFSPAELTALRADFPILRQQINGHPLAWLDNAATTQKPWAVIDALSRFYQHDNSNVHRGAHTLAARATDAYENARATVQRFLKAKSPREIVFVRGTTEAINLVAQSFGRSVLGPGDEVIVTTLEHHANIVPWQMVCRQTGAVLRAVPITDTGEVDIGAYAGMLGPRTKIVGLSHVSNVLGTVLPVREMTAMAHAVGARVLIDAAQSVAHVPVDVCAIGCDFFVFSGHKIFGPTGVGALYGRLELLDAMPPWQGGGNMIDRVRFEETTYAPVPAKFEAGTGILADAVGLGAAIDYVQRIGLERIARHEHGLVQQAMRELAAIPGVRLYGTAPGKAAVAAFLIDGVEPERVGKFLDTKGIAVRTGHHCAQPTMDRFGVRGMVRPSFAFYNTYEEIDRLIRALREMLSIR